MGRQEFAAAVIISQDTTYIGTGTVYGLVTVGTSPVELKVGASRVQGRTTLSVQADPNNKDNVYIGFDNTVSASKYGVVLTPGAQMEMVLDPAASVAVYAISGTANQKVAVIEGANA